MTTETMVERWAKCTNSTAFGELGRDEAGYDLRDLGINENYGCLQPKIVGGGLFETIKLSEEGRVLIVARLYGTGKYNDPVVNKTLEDSCGKCVFYSD